MSPAGDDRHYVRAVERAWSALLGRPALVSPREFEAIDGWRRRGVPLAVVLEVIGAVGKRRSGQAPKALTALSRAVDEAFAVVAAGRSPAPFLADARPLRSDALHAWQEALDRCPEGAPLHELLTRLLSEAAQRESGYDIDATLDASLAGAVPDEMLATATERTERALESFRRRMSEEEFGKTFARALADRLRATLGLPRVSLTRASDRVADGPRLD